MKIDKKIQDLEEQLKSLQLGSDYFIKAADGRCGQRFAIARHTTQGAIEIRTEFMRYEEFNCYFQGIRDLLNKFKR